MLVTVLCRKIFFYFYTKLMCQCVIWREALVVVLVSTILSADLLPSLIRGEPSIVREGDGVSSSKG